MSRPSKIDWPQGFQPETAILYATGEIHIVATPQTVWNKLVAVRSWPDWYPNAANVELDGGVDGMLSSGAHFRWTTYGLIVDSQVSLFDPFAVIGWQTEADDIETYFAFTLEAANGGTLVRSQEVANGGGAEQFKAAAPHALSEGHALWLASLQSRILAEAG